MKPLVADENRARVKSPSPRKAWIETGGAAGVTTLRINVAFPPEGVD